ncbi:MAG: DUF4157 domain-containing protein [Chitinophagaceae bacterium]|nr:DUF4157 domain-containing protein [Chitinophagaceae bacterium]
MADRVMRSSQEPSKPQMTGMIGRSVQRQCASCEKEKRGKRGGVMMRKLNRSEGTVNSNFIQRKCDHCKEVDRKKTAVHTILRRAETAKVTDPNTPAAGNFIQRACETCRKEEEKNRKGIVLRKSGSQGGFEASAGLAGQLSGSKGAGMPIPAHTKAFMENAFSTDFSRVRLHTGAVASEMNRELSARAFTYGNDIYFNNGQYNPETYTGKKLLAHELTHVVQQGTIYPTMIQKDDQTDEQDHEEDTNTDEQVETDAAVEKDYDPEKVLSDFVAKIAEVNSRIFQEQLTDSAEEEVDTEVYEPNEESNADTDAANAKYEQELADAEAWMGSGAEALRKEILLFGELKRLENPAYRQEVIDDFFKNIDDAEVNYLEYVKADIESVSGEEQSTMDSFNLRFGEKIDRNNFIDNALILQFNGANAFPDMAWEIVRPLIQPDSMPWIQNGYEYNQRDFYSAGPPVTTDMANNGLPVSYAPSLNLVNYSLVKNQLVPVLDRKEMPDKKWIYSKFIMPEEIDLHSTSFSLYTEYFTSYSSSAFQRELYRTWVEATIIKWFSYSTAAISHFRMVYPDGLHNIEQFYQFESRGIPQGLGSLLNAVFHGYMAGGANPFLILAKASENAREKGYKSLKSTIKEGVDGFRNDLTGADYYINRMIGSKALMTAIQWSIKKGLRKRVLLFYWRTLTKYLLIYSRSGRKTRRLKKP